MLLCTTPMPLWMSSTVWPGNAPQLACGSRKPTPVHALTPMHPYRNREMARSSAAAWAFAVAGWMMMLAPSVPQSRSLQNSTARSRKLSISGASLLVSASTLANASVVKHTSVALPESRPAISVVGAALSPPSRRDSACAPASSCCRLPAPG